MKSLELDKGLAAAAAKLVLAGGVAPMAAVSAAPTSYAKCLGTGTSGFVWRECPGEGTKRPSHPVRSVPRDIPRRDRATQSAPKPKPYAEASKVAKELAQKA